MKKIIPLWSLTRLIYPFPKDIKGIFNEIIHAYQLNLIKTVQDAFWSLYALDSVNQLDTIYMERIEKFILDNRKGFKFCNQKNKKDDLKTLFCALGALKILGRLDDFSNKVIDGFANSVLSYETNSGFVHCFDGSCLECNGKATSESIFYGLATLTLLDRKQKIDENKYLKILESKSGKKGQDLIYYLLSMILLDNKDQIDKTYFDQISEYEDESGGYKFSDNLASISDTFWIVSLYSGLDWLKNATNLGNILEFVRGIYKKREDKVSFYDMDLKDFCFSTLIISLIYDDLTEGIKNEILKQLYEREKVFYKELIEARFIKSDILEIILKDLGEKTWFNAENIDNEERYQELLSSVSRTRKFVVEEIIKRIKTNNRINLTEYANNVKSGAPIELTKKLMEQKIIIGNIEVVGRFLRKEHHIFRGYMPKKGIKRVGPKNNVPYFNVVEERERFPLDEKEVNNILDEMLELPDKINNKILNLVDCDKVNFARIELDKEYENALNFLNESNDQIKKRFTNYKYLSKKYIIPIENKWSETLEKTRINLEQIKKDLMGKIDSKKQSLKALEDLEKFQEFVENNLNAIKTSIEDITSFFQESIDDNKLEKNAEIILKRINKVVSKIDRLTPNLETQVNVLNKIVDKTKLMENIEVAGAKLEPLHIWLEREFLNKRSYTLKTLSEIKSKLFKRDELKEIIQSKKDEFDEIIEIIKNKIEENISAKNYKAAAITLKDKTKEALKFIEKTNKYILDFIKDTSNLIEGFDLVVDEIMEIWLNDVITQMQNQIVNLKTDLDRKILSEKEIDRRDKLDDLIEKDLREVKKSITEFKDHINTLLKNENNIEMILNELNTKHSNLQKIISTCNQQINQTLKSNISEFQNFSDTANVQIFKWESFKKSSEDKLRLIFDALIDKIIIKTIVQNQKLYPEGKLEIDVIKQIVNLKPSEIKNRIKNILASGTIEGEYYSDKNKVTIFNQQRKNIMNFEERLNKYLIKLNEKNKEINNFYQKSCKKRQIEAVTPELFNEIKETFDISNSYDSKINNDVQNLDDRAVDIDILMKRWSKFKKDLQNSLLSINDALKKRIDLKELINDSLSIYNTKIKEISKPIEQAIEKDQLNKAIKLLESRIENFLASLDEMDESIEKSVKKEGIEHFNLIVSDLTSNWKENKELLIEKGKLIKQTLSEKIDERIVFHKKVELKEIIDKKIRELKTIREDMEEKIYPQISIDLNIAQKKLRSMPTNFENSKKDAIKEINSFIKEVLDEYRNFKPVSKVLTNKFKKESTDIEDLFDQSYQMLEDEMIIKTVEDLNRAYATQAIELGLISNTLKISKPHLRDRMIQLIASKKLTGILDPYSNEYKFAEYISSEEKAEAEAHIAIETQSIFKRFSNLLKKWYSVVAFMGATIGIGVSLSQFNLLVAILIPALSLVAAIIFVFIKHYLEKKEGKIG